ncbi:MAG: glycosyl hydrolase family 8 [Cytophagaceae bacterium]
MKFFKAGLLIFLCIYFNNYLFAQTWPGDTIQVFINSGNPKFPFPQFREYTTGKSLALHNPVGVVHAEMEKTSRDAYRIMMNRALYTGQSLGAGPNQVRYIVFNNNTVPHNYGTFVSEGDGYALLAAAYMADKKTFDGLWCWIHDNRLSVVKRYINCADLRPTYAYGPYTAGWKNDASTAAGSGDNDSAADGDFDIGLALLIAYRQWGEWMGVNDACGNPISYRQEAIHFIKAMVEATEVDDGNPFTPAQYVTGCIGVDGYVKGGNTWGEMTNWAIANGINPRPACGFVFSNCNQKSFFDYFAPAYYRTFGDFLQEQSQPAWCVEQYRRAEASSDWLMGKFYEQGHIGFAGGVTMNEATLTPTFTEASPTGSFDGEAFRLPWRTISNFMWHGAPTRNWDPLNHAAIPGTNTYERDNALRISQFLKAPQNYGTPCQKLGSDPIDIRFQGNTLVHSAHNMNGTPGNPYIYMNWIHGAAAAAPVISEDVETLAKTYRQLELEWDVVNDMPTNDNERYINSTPKYFHCWYRVLGLLITTGNWHSPNTLMVPDANMKVYKAVSKTYGFPGDTLKYTISYRNYASINALNVKIEDVIPSDLEFVSASNGGVFAAGKVTWNIGTVQGFQTATGVAPTQGSVTLICRIKQGTPTGTRICNTATITCTNGTGWTSNEYPNNITATMERNCVDVVRRALTIEKTANRSMMNPGDEVEFTLNFENSSDAGWLDGGRPGITVTHGYGYSGPNTVNLYFRIFHGAEEAYIDYGNYRVSYFINDPAKTGFYPADPTGWTFNVNILEGGDPTKVNFAFQKIPFGTDAGNGRKWDQRLTCKFAPALAATSQHLYKYFGVTGRVHRGVREPFRIMLKLESNPSSPMSPQLADDWSFDGDASPLNVGSDDKSTFFPITPDWTDPVNFPAGRNVDRIHVDECRTKTPNYQRVLVEEFDGYTWRRVFGRGPLPGRETYNVVVVDTLPADLTWAGFVDNEALGITATYTPATRIIRWSIPVMLVGAKGDLKYKATANGSCPMTDKNFTNWAWIYSSTDSPIGDDVALKTTCDVVPPPPPPASSVYKTANKTNYIIGENITYKVKFINTKGSVAEPDLNNSTNWTARGGTTVPAISGGQISLGWAPKPALFTHDKAHGKNGSLTFTIDHDTWTDMGIVFRYQSGHPKDNNFQGVMLHLKFGGSGANSVFMQVRNNMTLVPGSYNGIYGGPSKPAVVKVTLTDGTLEVWINNLSGPPIYTVSGITMQTAGYVGYYNGNPDGSSPENGNHKINAWKSEFDSAFDVFMYDPIPADVSFLSANNAIYNTSATTKTGSNLAGSVTWQKFDGPMLVNDSLIYYWTGKVETCTNGNIVNTAYMKIYGVSPDPGAQVVNNCATVTPVTLLNFSAEKTNSGVVLSWSTVNEINNDFFLAQKSDNGIDFYDIGKIKGQGSKKSISNYTFSDNEKLSSINYYRLAQVDYDGTITHSNVISIQNISELIIKILPNPFNDQTFLHIDMIEGEVTVKMYNTGGKLLMQKTIYRSETIPLGQDLGPGVYYLHSNTKDQNRVVKVVKY